jgi:methyltransferase-like protein
MTAFHVASPLRPRAPRPELTAASPEVFHTPDDRTLTTAEPIVKAALTCLAEVWPRPLSFGELRREARARLGGASASAPEDARALSQALLAAFAGGSHTLVELSLRPPRFAATVSDRPEASPLARLQAASSAEVTSLRHQRVTLNDVERLLLPHLDGRQGRAAHLDALIEGFEQGRLSLERAGQPIRGSRPARPALAERLELALSRMASDALLVA